MLYFKLIFRITIHINYPKILKLFVFINQFFYIEKHIIKYPFKNIYYVEPNI